MALQYTGNVRGNSSGNMLFSQLHMNSYSMVVPQQFREDHVEKMKKQHGAITINDDEYISTQEEDNYRFIVLQKEIQRVRNVQSFIDYHTKHPDSLKGLLLNAYLASHKKEEELFGLYWKSKVNGQFTYPRGFSVKDFMKNGLYSLDAIPLSAMVLHSINWIQGLLIQSHQGDGFRVIQETREEAAAIIQKEMSIG